jgi:hypothetical protein
MPAHIDTTGIADPGGDRCWESMAEQPGRRTAGAGHVDEHRERETRDDDEQQSCRVAQDGHAPYRSRMCRSIKTLRRPGEAATTGELEAAARQYVRKISGYREPSAKNREAFEEAIAEIAHVSQHLVEALGVDVEDGPNRWVGRDGVVHLGT